MMDRWNLVESTERPFDQHVDVSPVGVLPLYHHAMLYQLKSYYMNSNLFNINNVIPFNIPSSVLLGLW